jgi:hypothetical protein
LFVDRNTSALRHVALDDSQVEESWALLEPLLPYITGRPIRRQSVLPTSPGSDLFYFRLLYFNGAGQLLGTARFQVAALAWERSSDRASSWLQLLDLAFQRGTPADYYMDVATVALELRLLNGDYLAPGWPIHSGHMTPEARRGRFLAFENFILTIANGVPIALYIYEEKFQQMRDAWAPYYSFIKDIRIAPVFN